MAHLAAGPGRRFTVQVKFDVGVGERRGPVRLTVLPHVAKQVRHRRRLQQFRRPERQSTNRPQLLLELAGPAGVEGEMARVVRPRRQLVRQQRSVTRNEELDAQDAHVIERLHHCARDLDRLRRCRLRYRGGRDRYVENVMRVRVLERAEVRPLAVDAARANHRDLAREIDEGLDDRFALVQRVPRLWQAVGGCDRDLSFPVVPERRRLDHAGPWNRVGGDGEIVGGPHRHERRYGDAERRQERLLTNAMLRNRERLSVRPHERDLFGGRRRRRRHVLELERDDVDFLGKGADRLDVVVRRDHFDVGDLARRRVVVWRERVDAVAEPARRHGKHATELAAAEHADSGPGSDDHGSVAARTSAVILSRYCCSFARSSGRDVARIATASSPALTAPDDPIATVATGTPLGIWTIDSSESRPFSAALWTGTPITGRTVCAATIPGRCAAPPAPATITSRPRPTADVAYSAIHCGVRCAETTRASCGTPNSARIAAAWLIVSQSDLLPMITPTRG